MTQDIQKLIDARDYTGNNLADALRIAVDALDEASRQTESTGVIGNDEVPTGIAETAQEALSEIKTKMEGGDE